MARPEELEEDAVKRAVVVAKKSNVPIVICGPTSKEALAVIAEERARGQVRTLEWGLKTTELTPADLCRENYNFEKPWYELRRQWRNG